MSEKINKVHLIFKTHLDVGFTDYAREVVKGYFEDFIPGAIKTAQVMRERGKRFIWTTGSWLIYEYLDQTSKKQRALLEQAIQAGDIVWHGLPFTTHTELMDAPLFRFGLSLSQDLDQRFGRHTIAAKMTDVPGHTRAIVPLLAEAGIQFLHIGVNHASTSPDVPPVFVWRDPTGADVIVMYHKDYGGTMTVPGLDEAIAFAHTEDNRGPQTPDQAEAAITAVQAEFPSATVEASTLDAFAASLSRVNGSLPVVTGELGDTWIQGIASDPLKVSRFRELLRLRNEWLEADPTLAHDKKFTVFSRFLLMVPEHTWGMDIKTHLKDFATYAAEPFKAARSQENFRMVEASWDEQREYLNSAIDALGKEKAKQARKRLEAIAPKRPDAKGFTRGRIRALPPANFEIGFDGAGSIILLRNIHSGHTWATPEHPLAVFHYQTFSTADYERFYQHYNVHKEQVAHWAIPDFTKPGLKPSEAESRTWPMLLSRMSVRRKDTGVTFLLDFQPPQETVQNYGCPALLVMKVHLPDDRPSVEFDFQWFEKPATRLPEAMWLSFSPKVQTPDAWKMDKLGELISPLEVVPNGNRHLHAVGRGVYYDGPDGSLSLESLDAPLVAPGGPSLLDFNNDQPALEKGMFFNLYNNIWGTNFRMWYDDDSRFRFRLTDTSA